MAERAKEDGELIDIVDALCRGPHTISLEFKVVLSTRGIGPRMLLKFLSLVIHANTLSSINQPNAICTTLHIPKHVKANNSQNRNQQTNTSTHNRSSRGVFSKCTSELHNRITSDEYMSGYSVCAFCFEVEKRFEQSYSIVIPIL